MAVRSLDELGCPRVALPLSGGEPGRDSAAGKRAEAELLEGRRSDSEEV